MGRRGGGGERMIERGPVSATGEDQCEVHIGRDSFASIPEDQNVDQDIFAHLSS